MSHFIEGKRAEEGNGTRSEKRVILEQFRDWLAEAIKEVEGDERTRTDDAGEESADGTRLGQFIEFVGGSSAGYPSNSMEEVTRLDESIRLDGPFDGSLGSPKQGEPHGASLLANAGAAADVLPEVGLRQLVEAFTAMRHDLKLQTKSARGLEGVMQSALTSFQEATIRFADNTARDEEAFQRAVRPYVETLVALDEAFLRGARAFASMCERITQNSRRCLPADGEGPIRRPAWWRRLFARGGPWPPDRLVAESPDQNIAAELARLEEGFTLLQSRIERAFQEHEIVRIDCAGRSVDPAEMTVVELVDCPEIEPEMVAQEVRPGYKWRGAVVRFAEVRAVSARGERDGRESA